MHGRSNCFGMLTGKSSVHAPVAENHDTQRDHQSGGHFPLTKKDCWSSSSITLLDEDDNLGKNSKSSQRSVSSLSIVNQAQNTQGTISDGSINLPFVNPGLMLWEEQRSEWTANHPQNPRERPVIRINATYNDLLSSSRPFANPIPLSEMTRFLVSIWKEEGLYG